MKLEACPVEPPGLGSGPLSIRTRSPQPRRARWWTRLLPTMPAPMTTARAVPGSAPAAPDCSSTEVTSGLVADGRKPDISHRDALVTGVEELLIRGACGRPAGAPRGSVRGVRRAGPAGGGDEPSLRRGGGERADRRDDHGVLRPLSRARRGLLRLSRLLPLPRWAPPGRPRPAGRVAAPQGGGRGGGAAGDPGGDRRPRDQPARGRGRRAGGPHRARGRGRRAGGPH